MTEDTKTLRDEFAMAALMGFLANPNHKLNFNPVDDGGYAYRIADAMLAERAKSSPALNEGGEG